MGTCLICPAGDNTVPDAELLDHLRAWSTTTRSPRPTSPVVTGVPETNVPNPGDWTDVHGAAEILGISDVMTWRYRAQGKITGYRIGRNRTLFWVPEITALAATPRDDGSGPARA